MSFSERYNYVNSLIQTDSLDVKTRNSLWNAIHNNIFEFCIDDYYQTYSQGDSNDHNKLANIFFTSIWIDFFKRKKTDLPGVGAQSTILEYCEANLDKAEWYRCYDMIEFVIEKFKIYSHSTFSFVVNNYNKKLMNCTESINKVLIKEKCTYRLVDGLLVPVTNDGEIAAIQKGLVDTSTIKTVHSHLTQALRLFSDRQEPDYRNSIKESISAIEALVKIIIKDEKATLGHGLKKLKANNVHIHDALIKSISELYGWTSDEEGVRHGQKTGSNIDVEDAQFSLIICCGIASYLIQKAVKAGVSFK